MTKKDYELIASIFNKYYGIGETHFNRAIPALVSEFTMKLKQNNPRFNETKFWKACGLTV